MNEMMEVSAGLRKKSQRKKELFTNNSTEWSIQKGSGWGGGGGWGGGFGGFGVLVGVGWGGFGWGGGGGGGGVGGGRVVRKDRKIFQPGGRKEMNRRGRRVLFYEKATQHSGEGKCN